MGMKAHCNLRLATDFHGAFLTVALDGAGKIKAETRWVLVPSAYLCHLVCKAGLAEDGTPEIHSC